MNGIIRRHFCFVLAACAAAGLAACEPAPELRLIFNPAGVVFGSVPIGEVETENVDILNASDTDIEIGRAIADAESITVSEPPKVLLRGEHANITVQCAPTVPGLVQAVVDVKIWEIDVGLDRQEKPFPVACTGVASTDAGPEDVAE